MATVDFLASQPHYLDHIASVWKALPDCFKGNLHVPHDMLLHVNKLGLHDGRLLLYERESQAAVGNNPVLVAAYGDLIMVKRLNMERKVLYMEHGTGHTFHSAAYPDGPGKRDWVDLFLAPNEYTRQKIHSIRSTPCEVIGTPKTDWIVRTMNPDKKLASRVYNKPPVVAIGFHWGSKKNNPPESGSAFDYYKDIIPTLKSKYYLIGYGHPLASKVYQPFFESLGIPYEDNLLRVFAQADVLINDLSSAMYEFLTTGKPVIVLNAPWFRRDVQHGLRFWDYSKIGINVEQPDMLEASVEVTLMVYPKIHAHDRRKALEDLYPYLGCSSERAAEVITKYLETL